MRVHFLFVCFLSILAACSPNNGVDQNSTSTNDELETLQSDVESKEAQREAELLAIDQMTATEVEQSLLNRAALKESQIEALLQQQVKLKAQEEEKLLSQKLPLTKKI